MRHRPTGGWLLVKASVGVGTQGQWRRSKEWEKLLYLIRKISNEPLVPIQTFFKYRINRSLDMNLEFIFKKDNKIIETAVAT